MTGGRGFASNHSTIVSARLELSSGSRIAGYQQTKSYCEHLNDYRNSLTSASSSAANLPLILGMRT